MKKIIRTSTISGSLNTFCKGQLRMLSEHFEVVAVSSPGPSLEEIAEREGVRTIEVPMERHISLLKDFKSLVLMIRVLAKEKPDIVHSITPKAGLITMLAAWLTRVPVRIHTFTGLVWPTCKGFKRRLLMFMDGVICRCATFINPEGQGVKNDLMRYGITRKPLTVIANGNVRGIDLEHYQRSEEVIAEAESIRTNAFTFCFIGRLTREKGVNELVAAFERLYAYRQDIRLLLVGSFEENLDPLNAETLDRIKNNPSIDFVGRKNDVRPWLVASDVFVFPSYREGFPNVVIEAGALGLPSIVTDINGSNEIISQRKNGVIIPAADENALYESMKRFLEKDRIELEQMGALARSLVARYDYHLIWDGLLKTYEQLVAE